MCNAIFIKPGIPCVINNGVAHMLLVNIIFT